MKSTMLLAIAMFAASNAFAADSCVDQAAAKKLAGAAKNSFMTKCERESGSGACEAKAAEKKLAGAAKNSFVKKCISDSIPR